MKHLFFGLMMTSALVGAAQFASAACNIPELKREIAQGAQNCTYFKIGRCYEFGDGVPVDLRQAYENYREGAELGCSLSQTSLGLFYERGTYVRQDLDQAVLWLEKAASQGYGFAQMHLGKLYLEGQGMERNEQRGYHWLTKQSAKRFGEIKKTASLILFEPDDRTGRDMVANSEKLAARAAEALELGDSKQAFFAYEKAIRTRSAALLWADVYKRSSRWLKMPVDEVTPALKALVSRYNEEISVIESSQDYEAKLRLAKAEKIIRSARQAIGTPEFARVAARIPQFAALVDEGFALACEKDPSFLRRFADRPDFVNQKWDQWEDRTLSLTVALRPAMESLPTQLVQSFERGESKFEESRKAFRWGGAPVRGLLLMLNAFAIHSDIRSLVLKEFELE